MPRSSPAPQHHGLPVFGEWECPRLCLLLTRILAVIKSAIMVSTRRTQCTKYELVVLKVRAITSDDSLISVNNDRSILISSLYCENTEYFEHCFRFLGLKEEIDATSTITNEIFGPNLHC